MSGRTRTQQHTIDSIQLLLDAGVDVNAQDPQGAHFALMTAAK